MSYNTPTYPLAFLGAVGKTGFEFGEGYLDGMDNSFIALRRHTLGKRDLVDAAADKEKPEQHRKVYREIFATHFGI